MRLEWDALRLVSTILQKNSSEAESFKHMKIKYPTHLKMAI
jgi:hypothetical protein